MTGLLLCSSTMAEATLIRESFNWGLSYSFRGLVTVITVGSVAAHEGGGRWSSS